MRSKIAAALAAATLSLGFAGVSGAVAVAADAPAASKYTVESTPIETLAADPAAKAVVNKYLPNFDQHPMYPQFKGMTLKALSAYPDAGLTDEKLKALQAELDALK